MSSVTVTAGRPAKYLVSACLVTSYLCIHIVAGDAVASVAYLLVAGSPAAWLAPQLVGGLGLALELVGVLVVSRATWRWMAAGALVSFVTSLLLFLVTSVSLRFFSLIGWFLIPFAALVIIRGLQVLKK